MTREQLSLDSPPPQPITKCHEVGARPLEQPAQSIPPLEQGRSPLTPTSDERDTEWGKVRANTDGNVEMFDEGNEGSDSDC